MIARVVLVSPILLGAVWYFDGRIHPHRDLFDFVLLPSILAYTTYGMIKRAKSNWNSFRLEFLACNLVRRLPGYPDLEIAPTNVKRIIDSPNGISILTSSKLKTLFVSKYLLNQDVFRSRLETWAPSVEIEPSKRSIPALASNVVSVLGCIGVLFVGPLYLMATPHHHLVLPLGIALSIANIVMVLFWGFRSPNFRVSHKYGAWILPALPLLIMIDRLH